MRLSPIFVDMRLFHWRLLWPHCWNMNERLVFVRRAYSLKLLSFAVNPIAMARSLASAWLARDVLTLKERHARMLGSLAGCGLN